jgi:hypothetical protein
MSALRLLGVVPLLAFLFGLPLAPQTPGRARYVLESPGKQQNFAEGLNRSTWPWRNWSGSFLVAHGLSARPDSPIIKIFDSGGALVKTGTVWFPSASSVSVKGVIVDPTGRIVASGASLSTDGVMADFITTLDGAGHPSQIVRTNPYVAFHLCSTGDGTVWALGNDRNARRHGSENLILREFSMSRGQIRAMLDVSGLGQKRVDPDSMWLVCNHNEVGVLANSVNQWIQFDTRTDRLSSWQLPTVPTQHEITGVAFTTSGRLVVSVNDYSRSSALAGLFVLSTREQGRAAWEEVKGSASVLEARPESPAELLGNDGNRLVYVGGHNQNTTAFWSDLDYPSD